MMKTDVDEYLYFEFNAFSPNDLNAFEKVMAFERLRQKLVESDMPILDYIEEIISIAEYLGVNYE